MMMAYFRQVYAVNTAGQPLSSLSGRVYHIDDVAGSSPLPVTGGDGIPISLVSISDFGVNQSFAVENETQVRWISEDGEQHAIFESLQGMEETARAAEATADTAVRQVAEFLSQVGVPGGVAALNPEGDVVDANDDVVGNDVRRKGAVTWAYGSTTIRPTSSRDVMVLWITDGPAPVNALPGIDYWLNGGVIK